MTQPTKETVPAKGRKSIWIKRFLYVLLAIFGIMQFFQPGKNNQSMDMAADISTVVKVSPEVQGILKTSCYDCHSNYTNYPWYASIQPVGWWLKDHVDEGKEHLNFQDFASLKPREGGRFKTTAALQDHKLEEVAETVEEGEMPLESYTLIHGDAKLNAEQKKLITDWVKAARAELMGQVTVTTPKAEN